MANIFPPVIQYNQDFVPNDMKMSQLERTLAGRKIKSYIPQYTGDSVEIMLYTVARFVDAMQTQSINPNAWEDQFGYTLHGDPSDLWDEVLNDGDDNGVAFDRDEAGFNLSIEFYVRKYVADPNARDTQFQAFNGGLFRFVIAIGDVAKHIRRIRTLYRYLPKLPGDVIATDAQIRHSVMNSFPKRWQQSFMRGGAERYHNATLDTIQQHMTFEKATEDSAAKAKGGKKKDAEGKKNDNKGGRGRGRYRSSRNNPSHPYNNYNNNRYNNESHYQDDRGGRGGRGRGNGGRGGGRGGRGNGGRGYQGNRFDPNYHNRNNYNNNNQNPYAQGAHQNHYQQQLPPPPPDRQQQQQPQQQQQQQQQSHHLDGYFNSNNNRNNNFNQRDMRW